MNKYNGGLSAKVSNTAFLQVLPIVLLKEQKLTNIRELNNSNRNITFANNPDKAPPRVYICILVFKRNQIDKYPMILLYREPEISFASRMYLEEIITTLLIKIYTYQQTITI